MLDIYEIAELCVLMDKATPEELVKAVNRVSDNIILQVRDATDTAEEEERIHTFARAFIKEIHAIKAEDVKARYRKKMDQARRDFREGVLNPKRRKISKGNLTRVRGKLRAQVIDLVTRTPGNRW